MSRDFKALLKCGGLPDVPFHALRHTAASLMLLNYEPPKGVQEWLGHTRISTTMDGYSRAVPRMDRDAAERLGVLLA